MCPGRLMRIDHSIMFTKVLQRGKKGLFSYEWVETRECGRLSLDRCWIMMKNTDQSQIIAQYHVVTIYFEWSNVEGQQRIFGACVARISSFLWVHPLWDSNVLLHTFLLLHADIWFLSNSLLYSAIFSSHAKGPWITKRSQPHKSEDEPWKCR